MAKGTNSFSKTAVWILLGLLILALGGFGATNLSGTIRTVGQVGDKYIDVQDYARNLQQEIQAVSQQTGNQLTFARAQAIGLDQAVLSQLVRARALDHEADQMGLSVGDETLRDEILNIPSFRGLDGSFDREAYSFALSNSGSSEAEFEQQLRDEVARSLLQGAIMSGISMPDTYAETLVAFLGETRDFTWVRLDQSDLTTPLDTPTDEVLRAFYDENIDDYELPETKRITYASLLPDMILDSVEVEEATLRAEYEARADEYNRPERRLVERLVYLDEASADQAAAQLEVNGTTFDALVQDRGLTLADVDLGDVSRLELDAAGEAVFTAEVGDVVGPLPSTLGPALFRVNGVLAAQQTSFEDARAEIQQEMALDAASRQVAFSAEEYDDLLAGGATLEELGAETDMQLGTVDWFPAQDEGIAAYDDFRTAAAALTIDDFPEIIALDEGGIVALRLDEILPPRPAPFEDVRDDVRTNWEAAQAETALAAQAEAILPALQEGQSFASQSLDSIIEEDQDRSAFVQGTPPSFMSTVFEMEAGDVRVVPDFGAVLIVRLDAINPVTENNDLQGETEGLSAEVGQMVATELFNIFSEDVVVRASPQINQQALDAVHVNFP
ncbi:peptidyl-prolyl cis-trans isomerase [uncultured Tateyamaria sp.]|uniref:peptidyl-prolyl cis-trans isomerase n=1 Tax=uncultured Tateyamaria sp. TaxID=455651 RepID=UPI0026310F3D|nr:peptidyl-prolyl cis-trans isomerase [uncultured Tateyamaria sp.]